MPPGWPPVRSVASRSLSSTLANTLSWSLRLSRAEVYRLQRFCEGMMSVSRYLFCRFSVPATNELACQMACRPVLAGMA